MSSPDGFVAPGWGGPEHGILGQVKVSLEEETGGAESILVLRQLLSRASLVQTPAPHLTLEPLEEMVEPQSCLDSLLSPLNLGKSPGD